jgi:hypothetical protein
MIIAGAVVRFTTDPSVKGAIPFTSISGVIVDPDVVELEYSVQGETEVVYTYTHGNTPPDPTSTIVRDGAGIYHADIDTTGLPGTWSWGWSCHPSSGSDTTGTQVVWEGELTISPASV